MLFVGRHRTRTCSGVTRRELLQVGRSTVLGLSLTDALRHAQGSTRAARQNPVLLLWLWGGPAHLDTWDPKPTAPVPFAVRSEPSPRGRPGVRFGELFPQDCRISDRLAVIRSLKTTSNDHGVAGTVGLTGANAGVGLNGQPLPGQRGATPT